jgi:integral membrane protein 2B
MTIVTKALTSEKKPSDQVEPLVQTNPIDSRKEGDVEQQTGKLANGGLNERYHYILRTRAARVSSATTLCLLITALLVMTVGLFGGLYIYKQMTRARFQKYRGWCNVPYQAEGRVSLSKNEPIFTIPQLRKIDNDGLSYYYGADTTPDAYFREDFELDLDDEKYSKVEVPDFKNGRMGRFIHEFESNKTAIVDQTAKRCFVMPLDREKVLPPRSMFDMIQKMSDGYYSVNTNRVRETMRVVLPPLDDLSDLGQYIQQECVDKTTYRLEKSTSRIVKRDAEKSEAVPFTEYTGKYTIQYAIENLDKLD